MNDSSASVEPVSEGESTAGERKDTYRLRPGGLMRCCTKTLDEYELTTRGGGRRGVLHCNYCKDGRMRYRDGAWEWADTPAVPSQP